MRHLSFLAEKGGGGGAFEPKCSKSSNARWVARGGMLKLQFHWYIIFKVRNSDEAVGNTNCCKLSKQLNLTRNSTEIKDDGAAIYFNRHIRQTFTERN